MGQQLTGCVGVWVGNVATVSRHNLAAVDGVTHILRRGEAFAPQRDSAPLPQLRLRPRGDPHCGGESVKVAMKADSAQFDLTKEETYLVLAQMMEKDTPVNQEQLLTFIDVLNKDLARHDNKLKILNILKLMLDKIKVFFSLHSPLHTYIYSFV